MILLSRFNGEAKAVHKPEHAIIVAQYQALNLLQSLRARGLHQRRHQFSSQSFSPNVVRHRQREIAGVAIGVDDVAGNA